MNRRSVLAGLAALTLTQLTSGCNRGNQRYLAVRLLENSIPVQLFAEFRRQLQTSAALQFVPVEQLQQLFADLQAWKAQVEPDNAEENRSRQFPFGGGGKVPPPSDLVTLGDSWLEEAIAQQLIEPLPIEQLSGWQQLPQRWQELVRRNNRGLLDEGGKIWGAPYRWGSAVIAYRDDKFKKLGWTPTDWQDLWREEVGDRISVLNHPQVVVGLTLKKLGYSFNTEDLTQVSNLKEELQALYQNVKLFSSQHYLEPLVLGDTWMAVGWSADLLPIMQRNRQIKAVVPQSGTALWADVWVKPVVAPKTTSDEESVVKEWINFCWQFQSAIKISLLSDAASPILVNVERAKLPEAINNNTLLLPEPEVIDNSEFLKPLPESTLKQYQELLALFKKEPESSFWNDLLAPNE